MIEIKKFDDDEQIVYGEVYAPVHIPDSDGDVMSAKNIEKMAHSFMKRYKQGAVDVDHEGTAVDAVIVESFIARSCDDTFIPGAWVVGVYVEDKAVWSQIKKGELNGFSMQGTSMGGYKEIEIDLPEVVTGKTVVESGHEHTFSVKFDNDGVFKGGVTDVVDGHYHTIVKGTVTNEANGHIHKFSFVELFQDA